MTDDAMTPVRQAVLAAIPPDAYGLWITEIAFLARVTTDQARKALAHLQRRGLVRRRGEPARGRPTSWVRT